MNRTTAHQAFRAALPIVGGYIVLGLPCGLLCQQAGLDWVQVLLMSVLFYSGAGQYMIPNMWLAGNPVLSIILSVSLVNTRQTLYSAALARYCRDASHRLAFLFSATVTDESFGVNVAKFDEGGWTCAHATLVNLFSQSTWTASCVVGCIIGGLVSVPAALASFAMTSIFICLLCMQKTSAPAVVAMLAAAAGVVACKCVGATGPAILVGALLGLCCGIAVQRVREKRSEDAERCEECGGHGKRDARDAGVNAADKDGSLR